MTLRTPLTIVGGFLGAGKTTLVNHVLRHAQGRRLAVLVNDFGAVNIDAELIAERAAGVLRLTNGCLCCSIGDSFVDGLLAVMREPQPPDHVIVETSGVAEPARVAELVYLEPALSLQGVVVLVDAERVLELLADKYVGDTVQRQIRSADLLILNKTDICPEGRRAAIEARLRALAPRSRIVPAQRGELPLDVVLGFDEARWGAFLDGAAPAHQPARLFASFVFEADRPFCAVKLRALLDTLPPDVLRAKGFVRMQEQALVLQVAGARWELHPGSSARRARTRIAVIGIAATMNETDLRERLSQALVETA